MADASLPDPVSTLRSNFARIYGLLENAIADCPDDLWDRQVGGYAYWHHLYHVFAIVDLFILEEGEPASQDLFTIEVARLLQTPDRVPSKEEIAAAAAAMRKAADRYFESLTPQRLDARHENRSRRYEREVSVFEAMLMLIGHGYYHLGACDTALRDAGYKGYV